MIEAARIWWKSNASQAVHEAVFSQAEGLEGGSFRIAGFHLSILQANVLCEVQVKKFTKPLWSFRAWALPCLRHPAGKLENTEQCYTLSGPSLRNLLPTTWIFICFVRSPKGDGDYLWWSASPEPRSRGRLVRWGVRNVRGGKAHVFDNSGLLLIDVFLVLTNPQAFRGHHESEAMEKGPSYTSVD